MIATSCFCFVLAIILLWFILWVYCHVLRTKEGLQVHFPWTRCWILRAGTVVLVTISVRWSNDYRKVESPMAKEPPKKDTDYSRYIPAFASYMLMQCKSFCEWMTDEIVISWVLWFVVQRTWRTNLYRGYEDQQGLATSRVAWLNCSCGQLPAADANMTYNRHELNYLNYCVCS